jgi:NAD-dependent dihydropyrimidine dehydrogenase PreA subunit
MAYFLKTNTEMDINKGDSIMINQKRYNRIHQLDKAAVLPLLTSVETESLTLPESDEVKKHRDEKSRGRVEIFADLCKGCLLCIEACPPEVLKMSDELNKMGYHPAFYVGEGCTGCGICFYICPEPGTIRVYKRVRTH